MSIVFFSAFACFQQCQNKLICQTLSGKKNKFSAKWKAVRTSYQDGTLTFVAIIYERIGFSAEMHDVISELRDREQFTLPTALLTTSQPSGSSSETLKRERDVLADDRQYEDRQPYHKRVKAHPREWS